MPGFDPFAAVQGSWTLSYASNGAMPVGGNHPNLFAQVGALCLPRKWQSKVV